MIRDDRTPMLLGQAAKPEALHDAMQWHVHYVARGGIASFAISAVDIALWDLRGLRRGESLVRMAGGASDRCGAYAGASTSDSTCPSSSARSRGIWTAGSTA